MIFLIKTKNISGVISNSSTMNAQGNFGSVSSIDEISVIKSSKYNKKKENFEPKFMKIGNEVLQKNNISSFRIPKIFQHKIENNKEHLTMERIHFPFNKPIICKFWGDVSNCTDWNYINIKDIINNPEFNIDMNIEQFYQFCKDLGKFHRLMLEENICLFEQEILIGKLYNETKNSLFLIDFDKTGFVNETKDKCIAKNIFNLYDLLVQPSYPKLDSYEFLYFKQGLLYKNEPNMRIFTHFTNDEIQNMIDNLYLNKFSIQIYNKDSINLKKLDKFKYLQKSMNEQHIIPNLQKLDNAFIITLENQQHIIISYIYLTITKPNQFLNDYSIEISYSFTPDIYQGLGYNTFLRKWIINNKHNFEDKINNITHTNQEKSSYQNNSSFAALIESDSDSDLDEKKVEIKYMISTPLPGANSVHILQKMGFEHISNTDKYKLKL